LCVIHLSNASCDIGGTYKNDLPVLRTGGDPYLHASGYRQVKTVVIYFSCMRGPGDRGRGRLGRVVLLFQCEEIIPLQLPAIIYPPLLLVTARNLVDLQSTLRQVTTLRSLKSSTTNSTGSFRIRRHAHVTEILVGRLGLHISGPMDHGSPPGQSLGLEARESRSGLGAVRKNKTGQTILGPAFTS
jgi:hypothetical protein